jgi:CubicO group peptidase (beta-lactamase class C family)
MRWLGRVLSGLLVLLGAGAVFGYLHFEPLLRTGTGYSAHNTCSVVLLAGRDDPEADLPSTPSVPYLTGYVNQAGRSAAAAMLWVLAKQHAYYTPGYGCTVADERPTGIGRATKVESDPNPVSDAPAPEMTPEVEAALAHAFGDDLSTGRREALGTRAVVVLRGGELVGERYATGFDANTPQLGWSMSTSVANLLVGRYAGERDFTLEDDHLRPEWTDGRSQITLDQLMRMTSGLSWDESFELDAPLATMLYEQADMGAYAASLPLAHAPGTYQQLSSGSTNILCEWLTGLADVPDTDFPRSKLFAPLGLSSAVWEPDASGIPVCSSYLWATPRDWAAIGQFALQKGAWGDEQLLPEDWMARSTTATPVDRSEEQAYAAGWWANTKADGTLVDPGLPDDTYWASGRDGQRLYVVPSSDLVVVRLGFSPELPPDQWRTDRLVADLVAIGDQE